MLWKKVISPDRKREAVKQVIEILDVSERKACRVLEQHRSTQRYDKRETNDEIILTERVIELASKYGRYGYRRVTALLRNEGWIVNHKRVERIWRREGLKVPQKQPKNRERVKTLLNEWYRTQARRIFQERLEIWLPRFERFDMGEFDLVIRIMKSRWGSCTGRGKITLNLKLIHVPKHFIDYVIVHELCHLVEHNHSSAFYALMSRIMLDWEQQREKLNTFEF